jgi:hypothetical protein
VSKKKKTALAALGDRPLYKNIMAAIALIGAVIGVVAGVRQFLPGQKWLPVNTEIIVDASADMLTDFEGQPKLEAAREALNIILESRAETDNLALREFSGNCERPDTHLAVAFAPKNKGKIQAAAKSLNPSGGSPMVKAIIEATADFNDKERFEKASKRIVVITGSEDICFPDNAEATIRQRLAEYKNAGHEISLDFRFIGVGLEKRQQERLSAIAEAAGTEPVFVKHRADLSRALRIAVAAGRVPVQTDGSGHVKPVENATSFQTLLRSGETHLTTAGEAISRRQYAAAESSLKSAKDDRQKSDQRLAELSKQRDQQHASELHDALTQNRQIFDKLVVLTEKMLTQAQSNDLAGYDASTLEFGKLAARYNANDEAIKRLLDKIQ